jgi:hypothetical protein
MEQAAEGKSNSRAIFEMMMYSHLLSHLAA